jgi:hypothetical protein
MTLLIAARLVGTSSKTITPAAACRQPLDGSDLRAILHHREREAGIDAAAVNQNGAGAALAVVAALLGSGEIEIKAQRVESAWFTAQCSIAAPRR